MELRLGRSGSVSVVWRECRAFEMAMHYGLTGVRWRVKSSDYMNRLWVTAESWMRFFDTFRTATPEVDEEWYLLRYPDVREAIAAGLISSAASHYQSHGRRERRIPVKPEVDEAWYLLRYPDVCHAIRHGHVKSAYEHFVQSGFQEGRLPRHPSA